MSRPLIGLTTYAEHARFGTSDTLAAVLPMAYVRAVHASGGRAVLVTPDDPGVDVLDGLDGLVLTGGPDLDPRLYHEAPRGAVGVRPDRDRSEMTLLRAAMDADLPVLGICRGMQLMAVAHGGSLHQHLPDIVGHHGHRPVGNGDAPGHARVFGEHEVRLRAGSLAHAILGDRATVNSYHHQAVADPGDLVPVGWDPDDDLIEVVEDASRTFAVGVQWHPEATDDLRVFRALVAAARAEWSPVRVPAARGVASVTAVGASRN
ncbi:MAG TPA: gamma-glutamyl-gamma-aminobutyrate hydrolase family protein [Micromonosporaceae bacterium]